MLPPPPEPPDDAVGAAGAGAEPAVTPFTKGAAPDVKGPFGPVLALRGAGLGALCPDMVILCSCT